MFDREQKVHPLKSVADLREHTVPLQAFLSKNSSFLSFSIPFSLLTLGLDRRRLALSLAMNKESYGRKKTAIVSLLCEKFFLREISGSAFIHALVVSALLRFLFFDVSSSLALRYF